MYVPDYLYANMCVMLSVSVNKSNFARKFRDLTVERKR